MGRKRAGGKPLDPGFLWPLVATRWVLGSLSLKRSRGYFLRYAKTDLGRIFPEKYAEKEFLQKKVPKSGHADGNRNSLTTAPRAPPRQNERVETSGP